LIDFCLNFLDFGNQQRTKTFTLPYPLLEVVAVAPEPAEPPDAPDPPDPLLDPELLRSKGAVNPPIYPFNLSWYIIY
jgi:hypothetical protein